MGETSACCSAHPIGCHAAALFSGSSLVRAIARHHCTPSEGSSTPACNTTWVYSMPEQVRSSTSRKGMLSRMLSWLIARSLPQPSLVLDDFNALHLLHMHPHTKACCRPWLDSAASGGEAECWQNLAPRNRKQNQTLYYADFRGYLSLEQSIGEDAKAYRHALGSQVILVAMSYLISSARHASSANTEVGCQLYRRSGCQAVWHG